MSDVNELINKKGDIISSKMPPVIDALTTSKSTTDQHVTATRQGVVFQNYRRYYGESELEFSSEADEYCKAPEKFYNFLEKNNRVDDFEKYFTKDAKKSINNIAEDKMKAILEKLLTTNSYTNTDILDKREDYSEIDSKKTIEELKSFEPILFEKLDYFLEFVKNNLDHHDKKLLLSYIGDTIK